MSPKKARHLRTYGIEWYVVCLYKGEEGPCQYGKF